MTRCSRGLNHANSLTKDHHHLDSKDTPTVSHLVPTLDPSPSVRFLPPPINPNQQCEEQQNFVNRLRNYIPTDQARTSNIRPNHPQFNLQERIHHSTPRQNVRTSSGNNILPGINQTVTSPFANINSGYNISPIPQNPPQIRI